MADQNIYDMTDTWNSGATTYNGIKMNVTDAASAAASKLINMQVAGAETFTVAKTGDVTATSTDAGATAGPVVTLYRNSASPAVSDIVGKLLIQGKDSLGAVEDYAELYATITDPTSASEAATWSLRAKVAGTMTTLATFGAGAMTPGTNDGLALGTSALSFSDLFLASGGVINWNSGGVTITHNGAGDSLAFGGASGGYLFDASLLMSVNTAINWGGGAVTLTHNNAGDSLAFAGATGGYTFDAAATISGTLTANGGSLTLSGNNNAIFLTDTSWGTRQVRHVDGVIDILNGAATVQTFVHQNDGNTTIAGTLTQNSDARLKENVETFAGALATIEQLRGVRYARIDNGEHGVGLIAQELQAVIPELVREDAEGTLSVSYGNIVGVLIEAVKELSARVREMEAA